MSKNSCHVNRQQSDLFVTQEWIIDLKSDLSAHIRIEIKYINQSSNKIELSDKLLLDFDGKVREVTVDNKKYYVCSNTKKIVVPAIQLDSEEKHTRVVEYNIEGFVNKYSNYSNINHILSFTGDKPNYIELKYCLPDRKGGVFNKINYRFIECEKAGVVLEYKEKEKMIIYKDYLYDRPYIKIPFMYQSSSLLKRTIFPAFLFIVIYLILWFIALKCLNKSDGSTIIPGTLILGVLSSVIATHLVNATEKLFKEYW